MVLEMHFGVGFVNFEANFQRILIVLVFTLGSILEMLKYIREKPQNRTRLPRGHGGLIKIVASEMVLAT